MGEGVIFAPFVLKLRFQKKVFINKHDNTLLCIVWYVRLQEELNLCTVWLLFVVTSNYSQDQWSHKFHHMYYPNRWLIWKEYNMSPKSVCVLSRYMVPHTGGRWVTRLYPRIYIVPPPSLTHALSPSNHAWFSIGEKLVNLTKWARWFHHSW